MNLIPLKRRVLLGLGLSALAGCAPIPQAGENDGTGPACQTVNGYPIIDAGHKEISRFEVIKKERVFVHENWPLGKIISYEESIHPKLEEIDTALTSASQACNEISWLAASQYCEPLPEQECQEIRNTAPEAKLYLQGNYWYILDDISVRINLSPCIPGSEGEICDSEAQETMINNCWKLKPYYERAVQRWERRDWIPSNSTSAMYQCRTLIPGF